MFGRKGGFAPLAAGDPASEFTLEGTRGGLCRLAELVRHGPVAPFFYPGNDTPGWNRRLSTVRDEQPKYSQKGVRTFGVNPASVQNHELRTVCLRGTDGRVRFAQRGVPDADEILEPLG